MGIPLQGLQQGLAAGAAGDATALSEPGKQKKSPYSAG